MAGAPVNSSDEETLRSCAVAVSPPGKAETWDEAQRLRCQELEARLSAQFAELARLCDDATTLPGDQEQQAHPIRQQAQALAQLHDELKDARKRSRAEQDWAQWEHQALRHRLDGLQRQLAEDRADLASREALLEKQERKLEHAFHFVGQQQAEIDAQRLRFRAQRRRVGASLAQRRDELRRQLQEFHDALATSGAGSGSGPGSQVEALLQERSELRQQLEQAEAKAAAGGAAEKEENEKTYELRRRFEMAVEDMRAYKHRVEELEQQLAQRPSKAEPALSNGPGNWAQQKAQMLASLETEMNGTDPKSVENRLTVEGAIRITDDVVAEKEAEIKQLQRQLEDLRTERVSAAAQDAAAAAILDQDAVIAAERERLRKLQDLCLEKQRAAEVELSVERAKLARQRVELEDRLHAMESDLARRQAASPGSDDSHPNPSKSVRGRWLARLGLSNDDPAG